MNTPSKKFAHKALKIAVYLLGAFYGFVGYSVLWFSQFVFRVENQDSSALRNTMGIMSILLGIYLLYVAYLLLWRFSSAGLKHACIVTAFYAWSLIAHKDRFNPPNDLLVWGSLIGVIVASIFIYRPLNRVLIGGMR